jgi:hypothetical protein
VFQEQLTVDLERQFDDIRSNVIKENIAENHTATRDNSVSTTTPKRVLTSLENKNLSHTRKSPRFPRRKD